MGAIYSIRCLENDKIYIGQTRSFDKRKKAHQYLLRQNRHPNKHLQSAYNKYGAGVFEYSIIEAVAETASQAYLNEREIYWIKLSNALNRETGFNNASGGSRGNMYAAKSAEEMAEIRKKMSASAKVKYFSKSHRENLGKAHLGKKHTEEVKKKMSAAWHDNKDRNILKGEKHPFYNKKHTAETLEKISATLKALQYGKRVICLNTSEVFSSAKTAGEFYNIDRS